VLSSAQQTLLHESRSTTLCQHAKCQNIWSYKKNKILTEYSYYFCLDNSDDGGDDNS